MLYAALIVLGVLVIFYVMTRTRRVDEPGSSKARTSNVISMESHRKAKQISGVQPCSSCKKKNGKLIFYAQDDGTVVGLCKECQTKAKKRDMLPL